MTRPAFLIRRSPEVPPGTRARTGILDLERAHGSGSCSFFRGAGSRLIRSLSALCWIATPSVREIHRRLRVDRDMIRRTLPSRRRDVRHEPTDSAIPTGSALTSMHADEIWMSESADSTVRRDGVSPSRARRDTLACCACTSSTSRTLRLLHARAGFGAFDDILARAESLLQELGLTYRLLNLCTGDLGTSSARTIDSKFSPEWTVGSKSLR